MPTDIEAAAARLRAEPGLIDRLSNEARTLATIAARRHPAGHEVIYAEVNNGLRAASFHPSAEARLLAVERVYEAMRIRQEEAVDQIERERANWEGHATQRRREIAAGGHVGRPSRDAALLEAINVSKFRLDAAWPKLGDGSEADFRGVLDDIETAIKALGSSVGVARRSSNARSRAAAAANAVAAVKPPRQPPEQEAA